METITSIALALALGGVAAITPTRTIPVEPVAACVPRSHIGWCSAIETAMGCVKASLFAPCVCPCGGLAEAEELASSLTPTRHLYVCTALEEAQGCQTIYVGSIAYCVCYDDHPTVEPVAACVPRPCVIVTCHPSDAAVDPVDRRPDR